MRPFLRFLVPFAACMCVVALIGGVPAAASPATAVIRDPAVPSYEVHLSSGAQGHTWTGDETVGFINLGATPMAAIWLRLWSNGVKGCGGVDGHDAIRVSGVVGGTAGTPLVNCTALRIRLDAPVPSGGSGTISMNVGIHVPARNDRFGYHHGVTLLGTALPTLAVRDDEGWHHTEPFIDLGESFYSIAGSYRVTLDTPARLATPATGTRVARVLTPGGRVRTTYAAKNVRDFAWAAGHLNTVVGHEGGVRVVVSYQPEGYAHGQARDALGMAIGSLRTYGRDFGAYPYREMDVVLTAFGTFGGMEYPTIIFTNPPAIQHEIAHQWWYGIVGDDEYHEPWLDEGFATWTEQLPPGRGKPWRNCQLPTWARPSDRLTNDMGYWNTHDTYGSVVYYTGGCLLANLAHRFGLARFLEVLHGYAQAHWFGVARTAEFRQAIEDAAAADGISGIDADYWAAWRVD
jgi:hypothetical protein